MHARRCSSNGCDGGGDGVQCRIAKVSGHTVVALENLLVDASRGSLLFIEHGIERGFLGLGGGELILQLSEFTFTGHFLVVLYSFSKQ